MRWQTADPIGFEDGLNLYHYVHNNPFRYKDPDGEFAIVFPAFQFTFGVALGPLILPTAGVILGCGAAYLVYKGFNELHDYMVLKDLEKVEGEEGFCKDKADKDPKSKYRDPNFSGTDKDLENHPDWKETTHPKQREAGSREFENEKTGDRIRFDKGDPQKPGRRASDHYHRENPNSTSNKDRYLDKNGNPVHKNDDASHLYSPQGITGSF